MVEKSYTPQRGDIIWLDFNPQTGREQAGRRPALVLSDGKYNERSELMVICPITSQHKLYPFVVTLPETLLSKPSYTLADQVKSLDWKKRNAVFIQTAPIKVLTEVTFYARGIIEGRNGMSI